MNARETVRPLVTGLRRRAGRVGSVVHLTDAAPSVVLTFDDGPDPAVTPALLDVLDEQGSSATFFLLAGPAREHPELVAEIVARGHQVGLHGLDHRRLPHVPRREAAEWLRRSHEGVEQLAGTRVDLFRPPHGAQSPRTWWLAHRRGLEVVLWNGTTWDWRETSQEERVAKALETAHAGTILLAHDGAHHERGQAAPVTDVDKVDLLRQVVAAYAGRGLRLTSYAGAVSAGARPVREARFPG